MTAATWNCFGAALLLSGWLAGSGCGVGVSRNPLDPSKDAGGLDKQIVAPEGGWPTLPVRAGVLSSAGARSCVQLDNKALKCWGANDKGQLGIGDAVDRGVAHDQMGDALPDLDFGAGETVASFALGSAHGCALLASGSVKCWGTGMYGQLGLGDRGARGDQPGEMGNYLAAVYLGTLAPGTLRPVRALAAGGTQTCAQFLSADIKCWGANNAGQLGLGDSVERGSVPGTMGDELALVELGSGARVLSVVAGYAHTCAILDPGRLKCWGANESGQLGIGSQGDRGSLPSHVGDALPAVDLGAEVVVRGVAAGDHHTCARVEGGQVKCWGLNDRGQLGAGDVRDRGLAPSDMGANLCAVDLGWGRIALTLGAGRAHTCALLVDGAVRCWGDNSSGQLGLGDVQSRGDEPGDLADADLGVDAMGASRRALAITAGTDHTCALLESEEIKCWGKNDRGQLGRGDRETVGNEPGEMGDALPAVDLGASRSVRR